MPRHWMVKSEPASYSWEQFTKDGRAAWTGVRNFQALNNLRAMKIGDPVLFYHAVTGKEVVGIAVSRKDTGARSGLQRHSGFLQILLGFWIAHTDSKT